MSTHTGLVLTANGHTCKYIAELFGVKNFFSQADTTIDANALLANGKLLIPSAADRQQVVKGLGYFGINCFGQNTNSDSDVNASSFSKCLYIWPVADVRIGICFAISIQANIDWVIWSSGFSVESKKNILLK